MYSSTIPELLWPISSGKQNRTRKFRIFLKLSNSIKITMNTLTALKTKHIKIPTKILHRLFRYKNNEEMFFDQNSIQLICVTL